MIPYRGNDSKGDVKLRRRSTTASFDINYRRITESRVCKNMRIENEKAQRLRKIEKTMTATATPAFRCCCPDAEEIGKAAKAYTR